jgi:hypothetical protein
MDQPPTLSITPTLQEGAHRTFRPHSIEDGGNHFPDASYPYCTAELEIYDMTLRRVELASLSLDAHALLLN